MLLVVRALLLGLILVFGFVFALLLCLVRPRHRNNVHVFAKLCSWIAPILGVKVVMRGSEEKGERPTIFTANHQNTFDMFTLTRAVPKATVSLGKKSLAWIPFFGQLYYLTGNILIDRGNRTRAMQTMAKTAAKIKQRMLSVWIFPEGTRSRGRGILPFKTGAFHTAIQAGVSITPVIASCQSHIKLNRWNNGVVIVEMLKPIATEGLSRDDVRALAEKVRERMQSVFERNSAEAKRLMLGTA
ncbi:1-acylglycerol-3-phosphate O-acyltransferase [Paraferrimonas sedimenticola]|uniref:1-acyl-sn-glycerol-3-phosphate acyltransferase n=1 Tax=Paraferrimonas sedimenticola TaxID=375674 RepID=A0AA37W1D7_9GAMM|nr:1-acylglycerol-3-phosphate O-acyltransferase [Paraferrimonas sedimenticola]GLP97225.1 1-acyl-sn-glycerol-3-phosphate acyltransferase [Paraferrimonas sedimenticola]